MTTSIRFHENKPIVPEFSGNVKGKITFPHGKKYPPQTVFPDLFDNAGKQPHFVPVISGKAKVSAENPVQPFGKLQSTAQIY